MRFAELQLIRYGRFEDCSLVFPSGDRDLQLILGPNEAGKSTTLEAVGDLLFGFPPRTRFAFRFDQRLLRIGAVLETADDRLAVRRRKGNLDTLLGPDDQPIDGSRLSAALAGQSRESFERMFGLDHKRLREGGQAILAAKDDIGAAIFAAGSGLVSISRVCEALDAEAKQIWTSKAGESRRYTAAAAAYKAAQVRLREAEVRPTAWTKARKELDTAEAELTTSRASRTTLAQQRRTVQRKQLVLAPAARRSAALEKVAQLADAPELSAEAASRCESALVDAQIARTEIESANAEVRRLEGELESARPAQALLDAAPDAASLRELKGVVDKGAAELAALQAQRDGGWTRISDAVAEIGWPSEAAAALKERLPGRPAVAEVRDLIEARRALDEQSRTAREAVREAEALETRLETQVSELPPIPDSRPLQQMVRDLRDAGHVQARQHAAGTSRELEQMLTARLRALAPWRGNVAELRNQSMPADEDVDHALTELEKARGRLETETEACVRESARLAQLGLDRTQASLAHPAPTREELDGARKARGNAWAPLRAHICGGTPLDEAAAAAADFETVVAETDRIADARFAAAEHAGGLARLEREIEKGELLLAQAEDRRVEAREALKTAETAFAGLITPLGVPLSAAAYVGWREARESALQAADALDLAQQDLQRAQNAEDAARAALAGALGRPDTAPLPALPALLTEAEGVADAAAEARASERELRAKLAAASEAVERAGRQAQAAADAETAWATAWAPALNRAGLPGGTSVPAARAHLEIIEAVRTELDDILELDAQISADLNARAEFERRVSAAAGAAGMTVDEDAMRAFAALQKATAEAAGKAERARTLEDSLAKAKATIRTAEAQLAASESSLSVLRAASPEADVGQLRDLVKLGAEAGRLRMQIEELEAEILSHGEGRTLEALIGEVADANAEALATEAEELDDRLERLNTEIEARTEVRGAAERAFKAIDDRPDAAIAAFEMAEARAEMAYQAELYIHKRAQARLLRAAVDRYRQEKQGPLLARASALFATLTLGAFARLIVDYDGESAKLAGIRRDSTSVVPVEGMSEGTVDQLFLALRVAAVEDLVAQGVRLPFVADDLFINFDDERAAAGFKVLGELSQKTQVLFFTHHAHLAGVADEALWPAKASVCGLDRDVPAPTAESSAA